MGDTDKNRQGTPGETLPSTYTTTTSHPKSASSINTFQNSHGSPQSSRKPAQESASYRQMLRKKVRSYTYMGNELVALEDYTAQG
jgi:hypothetical protein